MSRRCWCSRSVACWAWVWASDRLILRSRSCRCPRQGSRSLTRRSSSLWAASCVSWSLAAQVIPWRSNSTACCNAGSSTRRVGGRKSDLEARVSKALNEQIVGCTKVIGWPLLAIERALQVLGDGGEVDPHKPARIALTARCCGRRCRPARHRTAAWLRSGTRPVHPRRCRPRSSGNHDRTHTRAGRPCCGSSAHHRRRR